MFNLFRPNLPERKYKKYTKEELELRKSWIERRGNQKLIVLHTYHSIVDSLVPILITGFLMSSVVGVIVAYFARNLTAVFISMLIVFIIITSLRNKEFSLIEFDLNDNIFYYKGIIEIGGEPRFTDYLGPLEAVEGVEIIRTGKIRKNWETRFITSSGYLRLPWPLPTEVVTYLNNKKILTEAFTIPDEPIEKKYGREIFYRNIIDRTEFYKELRALKEKEKGLRMQERIEKGKIDDNSPSPEE